MKPIAQEGADARQPLKDRAYDQILERILNETYPPESFVSEREFVESLGMSKTPIRVALERLEVEGLVTISPQRGVLIRELSVWEAADIYDIRIAIEGFVARRIIGKITETHKQKLREVLAAQAEAAEREDEIEFMRLDAAFHITLCAVLDNKEIVTLMERYRQKLYRLILRVLRREPSRLKSSYLEHSEIFEALLSSDGERAASLLEQHLENGKLTLVR